MSKAKQLMELATQDIIAECANEKISELQRL